MLNPTGRRCWGFKEVRYGRTKPKAATFARDVAFLSGLCARPRIVLHTRADEAAELASKIVSGGPPSARNDSLRQRACFDAFLSHSGARPPPPAVSGGGDDDDDAGGVVATMAAHKGCFVVAPTSGGGRATAGTAAAAASAAAAAPPVGFRHTLEDYLQATPTYAALWRYLLLLVHVAGRGAHAKRVGRRQRDPGAGARATPTLPAAAPRAWWRCSGRPTACARTRRRRTPTGMLGSTPRLRTTRCTSSTRTAPRARNKRLRRQTAGRAGGLWSKTGMAGGKGTRLGKSWVLGTRRKRRADGGDVACERERARCAVLSQKFPG